jgi:hypothetical protein
MRYRIERDRADLVFRLDLSTQSFLRIWGRFLDGLTVRRTDLRVLPFLRDRFGQGFCGGTVYVLDPGAVFRFLLDEALVATAVYVIDRGGGVLIDDAWSDRDAVLLRMRDREHPPSTPRA